MTYAKTQKILSRVSLGLSIAGILALGLKGPQTGGNDGTDAVFFIQIVIFGLTLIPGVLSWRESLSKIALCLTAVAFVASFPIRDNDRREYAKRYRIIHAKQLERQRLEAETQTKERSSPSPFPN